MTKIRTNAPFALLLYKSTIHASIKHTPYYILNGRDVTLPLSSLLSPIRNDWSVLSEYKSEMHQRMQLIFQHAADTSRETRKTLINSLIRKQKIIKETLLCSEYRAQRELVPNWMFYGVW
jgi:hypothetical protein